ncbi:OLC1v1004050C1 [Oldenlandia corymbosa var. corymbosa]|uniref:OLC1v1004050C1 n=1 Tax=Oldenlandia corymbosa var. corymbosa TaxID=529605 RepID=A0AAV1DBE4_OLDCO|nr:OLC1v1004050C1 [Oldenlandia corymbosa var. corymbosa]
MQTPKSRNSSAEPALKVCSRAVSSGTTPKISPRGNPAEVPLKLSPRVVRQLKTSSQDSDSASSSTRASRTPKDRSSKVTERKSPRSPASEVPKKHPSKAAELEFQISQLQNDLKKVKEQLSSSEAGKKQAEQEADESKKQLLELSLKLEESHKQLLEKSNIEETQPQNASGDQDIALVSQLETIKKQQLIDSASLASALEEINSLKLQLETVAESEAAQTKRAELSQTEIDGLKINLTETLALVEDMKNQVKDSKESEAQAKKVVGETLMQLETAKITVESLRLDGAKAVEAYDAMSSELEQSRARVSSLEEVVTKLKADLRNADSNGSQNAAENHYMIKLESSDHEELAKSKEELTSLKCEIEQLRSALEASETRYNEAQSQIANEMNSAHDLVEQIKSSSIDKEAELEKELLKAKAEVDELKAHLMDKETELQGICEENEDLNQKLESALSGSTNLELEKEIQKARAEVEHVKADLMDRETEVQNILEENEMLKLEIKKRESYKGKVDDEIADELEAARSAEREALMKLGYMTEEVDKTNRRVARVSEQLDAAQAANAEMEAELRRLKVQSDQWRKAAEAAAAMLSTGNNGKFMDRTGSMDSRYSPRSARIPSPYSDDGDDDLLKRKSPNMLKKIGVLWRKPQK